MSFEPPVHSAEFRRRRALNWLTLGTMYAMMYMGRYNLSFANKALSDAYGWDKAQIGKIISAALLAYGLSALFNGPIGDRLGGRRSMLLGACGSIVFNLFFGLGAYLGLVGVDNAKMLTYFGVVWGLNSYFQSFSALSLIKVNASWFHVRERGVFSGIFGSMIQSGRFLMVVVVGPFVAAYLPWQWVFFIPCVAMGVLAILTYLFVRDAPEDAGFEDFDTADASSGHSGHPDLRYVFRMVFTNPVMITIAVAEFCTGFVRHGFEQWFPRYMQEVQHLQLSSGVFMKSSFVIVGAGILGALAAGTLSDWLFRSRRTPMACVGYVIQVACLAVISQTTNMSFIIAAFVMNSFAISIVHSMLSGTASMDFGGKKAAASAAGFFDGMQYVGGATVGWGVGALLEAYGWSIWAYTMIGFSAVGAVLMMVLWHAMPKKSAATPAPASEPAPAKVESEAAREEVEA